MTLLYQRGRRGGGDSPVKFRPVIPDLPENLPRAPGLPCLEAEPFRLGERLLCRGRLPAFPGKDRRPCEVVGCLGIAGPDLSAFRYSSSAFPYSFFANQAL